MMHRLARALLAAAAVSAAAIALSPPPHVLAQEEDPAAEAAALVEISVDMVERGSYEDAERKLRRAVTADGSNVDAALLLARVLSDTGRVAEALTRLEAAPGTAEVLRVRAATLV